MEDDLGMDQHGFVRAELFGGKAVWFQITGALVGEEDVGILQQVVELSASSLELSKMVERIPTCTSQSKASTSVALGRRMLRKSAPYMARSRPIAPPAIACPIPDARTPSNGFFPSFWEGMGSLSPIFSTVIKGIVERTSVYCAGSRNSPPDLSPAQGMSLNYVWLPKCTAGLRNYADGC
jgi:hypothetical protein